MTTGIDDVAPSGKVSDKALSIIAFAAYHQIESGQQVTSVIRADGSGHKADEDGVRELVAGGLLHESGNDLKFSDAGLSVLAAALDGLRSGACRS